MTRITRLHFEQLLQLLCTVLCSSPMPLRPAVPTQIKKIFFHFLCHESLRLFSYLFVLMSLFFFFFWARLHFESSQLADLYVTDLL